MEYGKGLFALGVVSIIGLAYVRFYQDSYTPSTAEQTADSIDAKLDAMDAKLDKLIEKMEQEKQ